MWDYSSKNKAVSLPREKLIEFGIRLQEVIENGDGLEMAVFADFENGKSNGTVVLKNFRFPFSIGDSYVGLCSEFLPPSEGNPYIISRVMNCTGMSEFKKKLKKDLTILI